MLKISRDTDSYGQKVIYVEKCDRFLYEKQIEPCHKKSLPFKNDEELFVYIKRTLLDNLR